IRSITAVCYGDNDCDALWPKATCRNGRCVCPPDTIRRKSDSYDWVCLSLIDASTGMLGPPVTCPLPEGAGYRTVLVRDGSVFCQSKKKHSCPFGYECIKSISLINSQGDGVCCPRRETVCHQKVSESADGWVLRWYFNGDSCAPFKWNPEKNTTANNFSTKKHCETYCACED
uniref:BPTI/Kunitz inhibitor domain-containing protein n=1 Tax=Parascaris univalens TaxID=6257 RepID=A0A915BJR7_PARUN